MGSGQAHHVTIDAAAQVAASMLEIFGAQPARAAPAAGITTADERALWVADALHRANNLSQMSAALGHAGERGRLAAIGDDHVAQARALSRAYEELAASDAAGSEVPCAPLLEAIAVRLVALFGSRGIALAVSADPVSLPAERRRALTLIASELIINALKYAFVAASGTITVALAQTAERVRLSVADDGRGLAAAHNGGGGGGGSTIVARLAALLDAEVRQASSPRGLIVTVSMPRLV